MKFLKKIDLNAVNLFLRNNFFSITITIASICVLSVIATIFVELNPFQKKFVGVYYNSLSSKFEPSLFSITASRDKSLQIKTSLNHLLLGSSKTDHQNVIPPNIFAESVIIEKNDLYINLSRNFYKISNTDLEKIFIDSVSLFISINFPTYKNLYLSAGIVEPNAYSSKFNYKNPINLQISKIYANSDPIIYKEMRKR